MFTAICWLKNARKVVVNKSWNLGTALDTTKGRALPLAAGNELEGSSRDLLAGGSHTNDGANAPALATRTRA